MSVSRRRFLQSAAAASALAMPAAGAALSKRTSKTERSAKISYDRFSPDAIKVLQLANQEAQRLHHDYVGTEHLLLALFAEAETRNPDQEPWLSSLGADYEEVQRVVETVVGSGEPMILTGKLPQSDNFSVCISKSVELADELFQERVCPEHLMLAIVESFGTSANLILSEMWIERGSVRLAIEDSV